MANYIINKAMTTKCSCITCVCTVCHSNAPLRNNHPLRKYCKSVINVWLPVAMGVFK